MMLRMVMMVMVVWLGSSLAAAQQVPTPQLDEGPPALSPDHKRWAVVLTQVAHKQGVDYRKLFQNPQDLQRYRQQLAVASVPADRAAQLAFWINAYNAVTLDLVIRTLPDPQGNAQQAWAEYSVMTSVKDFWTAYTYEIAGEWLTIDAIQKEKLAALNEPRIHFAINCASISCPPLLDEPFVAERLEQQLAQVTRRFVADEQQVTITNTGWTGRGRKATVNPLMQWYRKDFGGSDQGVRDFLARHAKGQRAKDLAKADIVYGDYNWGLNVVYPDHD